MGEKRKNNKKTSLGHYWIEAIKIVRSVNH